jgi:hypothetical protein
MVLENPTTMAWLLVDVAKKHRTWIFGEFHIIHSWRWNLKLPGMAHVEESPKLSPSYRWHRMEGRSNKNTELTSKKKIDDKTNT